TVASDTRRGVQFEGGLYGGKSWRRGILGVDYRGDYRLNRRGNGGRSYNGSNHALSVDYQHQLSRRAMLFFRETAGTSNRAFGGFSAPAFSDTQNFGVPIDEVFDTRVYFSQTSASYVYRQSARATMVGTVDYFAIKRPDTRLTSAAGKRALGAYQYQFSRRLTAGFVYQYFRFGYPRAYGQSDSHAVAGTLRRSFGARTDLTLSGGIVRTESIGNQQVQLSPEIAAVIGRTTGIEAFHRVSYSPQMDVSFYRRQERGSFRASLVSGVSPGNGIYLTSHRYAVSSGYSYTGIRRWSLGLNAGWSKMSSRANRIGGLTNYRYGGGANYKLADHWSLSTQVDQRNFSAPGVRGRNGVMISFGVAVSPSRLPLSIW
ncbi:MAG TPA: hypothetical protein VEQ63_08130, partial [Bryobacteraceae bacterium]|nr:hypothetical protein [Bryobacteraceae bacterium]